MRAYSLVLRLFPSSFRQQYGEEMRAVFLRRRREASGPLAVAWIWIEEVVGTIVHATGVHAELLVQDLKFALRSFRRSPGFALTAVVVVALGVGANTAVFTVTDYALLRPLPFRDPGNLVKVYEDHPGYRYMEASPANFRDWQRLNRSFTAMGAFESREMNLVGQGEPVRLEGASLSAEVIPLLGIRPQLGRVFTTAEDRQGASGTVLLSDSLWRTQFGADPAVVGRPVRLEGEACVVVGVMPAEFQFPSPRARFWVPFRFPAAMYAERDDNELEVVARLRPGVSLATAAAQMSAVGAQLAGLYKEDARTGISLIGMRQELSDRARMLLVALCGAGACVLLIACANLAALLLARAMARQQELEVRAALGAGRERLVRQLVTESVVLALCGGGLGLTLAAAGLPLLTRLVPSSLPIAQAPTLDIRALLVAATLSGVTGLFFGLLPALRAGRSAQFTSLRGGTRAGGGRRQSLRTALVAIEVAVSIVLLVGTGLLLRALVRLQATDTGFRPERVVTLRTALPQPKYTATLRRTAFYQAVLTGSRAIPGVMEAGYTTAVPISWKGGIWPVSISGETWGREAAHAASLRFVTPRYFATMAIPVRRGRDVSEADTADRLKVAVVSASFAARYWPDQEPLGRTFRFAAQERTVVGVVGDVKVRGLEQPSEPQVYLPYQQVADGSLLYYSPKDLVVRSTVKPEVLIPRLRALVHGADPEQPISDIRSLSDIVTSETASRAVQVRVIGAFALLAAVLAAVGIHGLLSFAVSQRRREIGVRRALGAPSSSIVRDIVGQGALTALAGLVPGLLLAYAAARGLQALLVGLGPADPVTFGVVAAFCAAMTVLGSLVPALRAVAVDSMTAIRAE